MTEREKVIEELSEILRYETIAQTLRDMIGMLSGKEAMLGRSGNIPMPQEPIPPQIKVEERYQEKLAKAEKNQKPLKWGLTIGSIVVMCYLAGVIPMAVEWEDAGIVEILYFISLVGVPILVYQIAKRIKPPVTKVEYTQEEKDKLQVYQQISLRGYQKEMEDYHRKLEADRKRVEQERVEKVNYQKLRDGLEQDLTLVERGIRFAYAASSLYPSYRNLQAAVALYHYFCSGQCDTLKEAYNVYGIESRMDRMIGRLDELQRSLHMISAQMSEIGQNQRILLKDMDQSQQALQGMQSQLNSIEGTAKVTAVASSVNAWYSGVAAKELSRIREKCGG